MTEQDGLAPVATSRGGFRPLVTTAGGVYGLVLVAGMIVISRNITDTSTGALGVVMATLLVFFVAHVYADVIGFLADPENRDAGIPEAIRFGVQHAAGLLILGSIPVFVLVLGVVGVVGQSDAVWLALAVDMLLLGVLGWTITAARAAGFLPRLGGALLTATLGGVMILLKVLIH